MNLLLYSVIPTLSVKTATVNPFCIWKDVYRKGDWNTPVGLTIGKLTLQFSNNTSVNMDGLHNALFTVDCLKCIHVADLQ